MVSGDILIVDNASIHGGQEIIDLLYDLLTAANVKLVFLPAYSPELNPCEPCFGYIKEYLRWYRDASQPLWKELAMAVSLIDHKDLHKYYAKCFSV